MLNHLTNTNTKLLVGFLHTPKNPLNLVHVLQKATPLSIVFHSKLILFHFLVLPTVLMKEDDNTWHERQINGRKYIREKMDEYIGALTVHGLTKVFTGNSSQIFYLKDVDYSRYLYY